MHFSNGEKFLNPSKNTQKPFKHTNRYLKRALARKLELQTDILIMAMMKLRFKNWCTSRLLLFAPNLEFRKGYEKIENYYRENHKTRALTASSVIL